MGENKSFQTVLLEPGQAPSGVHAAEGEVTALALKSALEPLRSVPPLTERSHLFGRKRGTAHAGGGGQTPH